MKRKSDKPDKPAVVAFKVEKELADILDGLPNKSAFIREAIVAHLRKACPLCNGTGMVPEYLHKHYTELLDRLNSRQCDSCGDDLPLPRGSGELATDDRNRLEQFFHGGPLYCDGCYDKAPTCGECGWHIDKKVADEHHRQAHPSHP